MRLNFKKAIALTICLCFMFTFNFNKAFASTNSNIDKSSVKIVTDNDKECTVMAEYKGDKLYATLDKETNEITMESVEKPKSKILGFAIGKETKKNYKVKVDNSINGKLSAIVVEDNTKKEFKLNKDLGKVTAQIPLAIPLIEILGGLLIEVLLGTVACIVVGGITYYAATKVIEKIKQKNYNYYAAYTVPGDDVYIGNAIDYKTAVGRLMSGSGNDVFSKTSSLAYGVAYAAGGARTPVGPEIGSGSGKQYYHYHVYGRWYGTHSFFAVWG